MYIHNHNLVGGDVDYLWSKKNKTPLVTIDTIVIHYTAGGSALSSAQFLAKEDSRASAHLVIARNGKIYQLVDFETQAWHAGQSRLNYREHVNSFSIGIELENPGYLKLKGGKYVTWFGKQVSDKLVEQHPHPKTGEPSYWHSYTLKQLKVTREVCILLNQHYSIKYLVGHSDVSLSGKVDPGPAFPLKSLQDATRSPTNK